MSIQSVTISFNGCQKKIPVNAIPLIDEPIYSVLAALHKEEKPPLAMIDLTEKIHSFSEIRERLQYAKTYKVRSFLTGILPTALLAGFAAAAIFGFITHPLIGMGVTLFLLTYLLFCHIQACRVAKVDQREEKKGLALYPIGVLLSPLFLSYFYCTRLHALKSMASACHQEIQTLTSKTLSYWISNSTTLTEWFNKEEIRVNASLLSMEKQPIRSIQGEKELSAYKKLLGRTKIEISKAQEIIVL